MPTEAMPSSAAGPSRTAARLSIAFLINPISGGGVGKRVYNQLPEIMDSFGFQRGEWKAELTEAARLEQQTDSLLHSARRVIAVGGDGTIGFVLNRLRAQDLDDTEIGLIPLGTGNDLGRALGIFRIYNERGLLACVKRLLKAQCARFDLWDLNGRLTMASYVSLGMDAAVLHDFDVARKAGKIPTGSLFNKLFYVKAFMRRSTRRISGRCILVIKSDQGEKRVELDGSICCVVGNINSYAAGARVFPSARFDDRFLEVAVFDKLWKFSLLVGMTRVLPRFAKFMGRHIRLYHARSVEISGGAGEFCQLDGEDITGFFKESGRIIIRPSRQVQLLDLRRAFFSLF
ncbi:MAG TPA: diacylglycerol kinase family protein [Fibrobacteria bacterium]|nr:diacylglycerol kinase family protein [Fibrobacteria bacterium]